MRNTLLVLHILGVATWFGANMVLAFAGPRTLNAPVEARLWWAATQGAMARVQWADAGGADPCAQSASADRGVRELRGACRIPDARGPECSRCGVRGSGRSALEHPRRTPRKRSSCIPFASNQSEKPSCTGKFDSDLVDVQGHHSDRSRGNRRRRTHRCEVRQRHRVGWCRSYPGAAASIRHRSRRRRCGARDLDNRRQPGRRSRVQ